MSGSRVFTVCGKLSFVSRPHLSRKTIEPMETEENTLVSLVIGGRTTNLTNSDRVSTQV